MLKCKIECVLHCEIVLLSYMIKKTNFVKCSVDVVEYLLHLQGCTKQHYRDKL